MTALRIDALPDGDAREKLASCCGATRWVDAMLAARPFGTLDTLLEAAERAWDTASRDDVLEALGHHPRIGGDLQSLRDEFAPRSLAWSGGEQAGVHDANEATLLALGRANVEYERRFGYTFVVCATGKSAQEMLDALRSRLDNDPEREWRIAAAEQLAITRIRIRKLEAT